MQDYQQTLSVLTILIMPNFMMIVQYFTLSNRNTVFSLYCVPCCTAAMRINLFFSSITKPVSGNQARIAFIIQANYTGHILFAITISDGTP